MVERAKQASARENRQPREETYTLNKMACPFIYNADKISRPKRSVEITDRFTCTSAASACTLLHGMGAGRGKEGLHTSFILNPPFLPPQEVKYQVRTRMKFVLFMRRNIQTLHGKISLYHFRFKQGPETL